MSVIVAEALVAVAGLAYAVHDANETTKLINRANNPRVANFTVANPGILPYGMVRTGTNDIVVSDTVTGKTEMTFNHTARTWKFVNESCCCGDDPVHGEFADVTNFQVKDMNLR